jgi:hypothetical protein
MPFGTDPRKKSAGRRAFASTALMVAGTVAVVLTSYSLSLKVSGERAAVEMLARENRALAADVKTLDAELRVRMRLPQLQRWNDDVLGLMPITAEQYLDNPVRLAAYGSAVQAPPPKVQLAIRDAAPMAARPEPRLVSAERPAPRAIEAPRPAEAIARPLPDSLPIDPLLVAAVEAAASESVAMGPAAEPVGLHRVDLPAPTEPTRQ